MSDRAAIAVSNSYDVGGDSICVFLSGNGRYDHRSQGHSGQAPRGGPGLFVYERTSKDMNWKLTSIQTNVTVYNLASTSWVQNGQVVFSVAYQTVDRAVFLIERIGSGEWGAPVKIVVLPDHRQITLFITSGDDRTLWTDHGERYVWNRGDWPQFIENPNLGQKHLH
ncbi:hypothetical protein FRB94_014329 [Tulasnella sp. JGI-2019a]|nr:hypothetical protein FRB94_014329 [Tulasnella sp. JGI-2019a]KAG9036438.1 hypothetical protein FRB95_008979 [Tulasnella sp. JGI-2019a]